MIQLKKIKKTENIRKTNLKKLQKEKTGGGAAIKEEKRNNHKIRNWRSRSLTINASIEVMRWGVYGVIGIKENKDGGESWREIGLISLIGLGWVRALRSTRTGALADRWT